MARTTVDSERMAAWEAFLGAHAAVTEILDHELVSEREMPLTWYDVLINLHNCGGRARMQELAASILFSKSGLTRLVDRMEKAGAVARESCPQDLRGTYAVITPAGRRLLQRARPIHHRGIDEHFAQHLTVAEARAIQSSMRKVIRALRPDGDGG